MRKALVFFCLFSLFIVISAKTREDLTVEEQQVLLDAHNEIIFGSLTKSAPIFKKFVDDGLEDDAVFSALADAYLNGQGVEQDINQAIQLYKKSYKLGNDFASFNLAKIYFDVWQNYPEAKKWFEKTVEKDGYDKNHAAFYLGSMYLDGLGVRQDCARAISYFENSAATIYESFNGLGTIYSLGCGVAKDLNKAKEYFGQSCDKGDQTGCDEYKKLNMSDNP